MYVYRVMGKGKFPFEERYFGTLEEATAIAKHYNEIGEEQPIIVRITITKYLRGKERVLCLLNRSCFAEAWQTIEG